MRLALLVLLLGATTFAKEEESNEVVPPRPPINLDANLRRALLKALTELENEERAKFDKSETTYDDLPEGVKLPHLDTRDKVVEKASASALSFFARTDSSSTPALNSITTTERIDSSTTEERPIVYIQRSNGIQHKPITSYEAGDNHEQFLTSATSSFTSSPAVKLVNKASYGKNVNSGGATINQFSTAEKSTTRRFETTTPSTTTTSTEESQAKVEDVQFFSAPLVAAFTVHQDERGLPKSVEPIFKNTQQKFEQRLPFKDQQQLFRTTTSTQGPLGIEHPSTVSQQLQQQQQQNNVQLRAQHELQQKQKALEDEILRLKQQQLQQNYLIRQQQLLHEQQLQLQKQRILEEQARHQHNQRPFVPIINTAKPVVNTIPQATQAGNFASSNNSRTKGTVVLFQPSISFNQQQAEPLPLNAQHLPVKNPTEFRSILTFPEFLQQTSTNTFRIPQPQLSLTAPKHNRVFRQEAETGNFFNTAGFSSNSNKNNNNFFSNQQQQNNRFFRSNTPEPSFYNSFNRIQPPLVNQHLNSLLYNSGIGRGRQQEDLNIVSKVLSLNHYGGGDLRFDSSNASEQRVAPPSRIAS